MPAPVILVFSPWRWTYLCQRPQPLMSRLAGRWQVMFVEEPRVGEGPARLELREVGPCLTVLVPHLPAQGPDDGATLRRLLSAQLRRQHQSVAVAWLYTPEALALVRTLEPTCIVYDCVDRGDAGKDASGAQDREESLLDSASLVFTAGPSLYAAQRREHPHVYCLPCAVDAARFAPAQLRHDSAQQAQAASAQGSLARPRLGYFGVIDRRIDFALLTALADSHPDWSVVLAGPVVGIDPAGLPRRPNLHWLGPHPADRLPHLLAGWDLCLLPFVHDDSTRYLNPSQTLEYMAADKPVVSSAIRDVLWLYGDAVAVAPSAQDFVPLCAAVLTEGASARGLRSLEMASLVFMHSWDRSADSVHKLMTQAIARVQSGAAAAGVREALATQR